MVKESFQRVLLMLSLTLSLGYAKIYAEKSAAVSPDQEKIKKNILIDLEKIKKGSDKLSQEDSHATLEKGFKEHTIKLPPNVLKDQYHGLPEREKFLNELLKEYSPTDRQELINKLVEAPTNQKLLTNLSPAGCTDVGKRGNPIYAGASPVIDWLNTAHFNGFFQPAMNYALVNREMFNEFDSFNQWGLSGDLFGFYTPFQREDDALKFKMYTVGLGVGGEYEFFDRLVLGLGLAYSHSKVNWQKDQPTVAINSLYFGPSLSYIFSHGYLSCSLLGLANFYKVNREVELFEKIKSKSTTEYQNWNILGRLEGGFSYEVASQFFLYPTARLDYMTVLMPEITESLEGDEEEESEEEATEIKTAPFHASFLTAKAGLKLTREFFYEGIGYLIPHLSGGWLGFSSVNHPRYVYEIGKCPSFKKEADSGAWNQAYVGAGFTMIHPKGILISLGYELMIGANSPVQAADIRLEFSW